MVFVGSAVNNLTIVGSRSGRNISSSIVFLVGTIPVTSLSNCCHCDCLYLQQCKVKAKSITHADNTFSLTLKWLLFYKAVSPTQNRLHGRLKSVYY